MDFIDVNPYGLKDGEVSSGVIIILYYLSVLEFFSLDSINIIDNNHGCYF
jgi:hypothetical protein